jgi:hypothetical protein
MIGSLSAATVTAWTGGKMVLPDQAASCRDAMV